MIKSWAYGITCCHARRDDLLPRTLASLKAAGFDRPRLFADGVSAREALEWERRFPGLELTTRYPTIRTYLNWLLALAELFGRHPDADAYLIAQDDIQCVRNLRQYLEKVRWPELGYLNLHTQPRNQKLAPPGRTGFFLSDQRGLGAQALAFSREACLTLLEHPKAANHMAERPLHPRRGWRAVDGGVVTALRKAGWAEWCHSPSLVQHVGRHSSMGTSPQPMATSFPGEQFDALSLLGGT